MGWSTSASDEVYPELTRTQLAVHRPSLRASGCSSFKTLRLRTCSRVRGATGLHRWLFLLEKSWWPRGVMQTIPSHLSWKRLRTVLLYTEMLENYLQTQRRWHEQPTNPPPTYSPTTASLEVLGVSEQYLSIHMSLCYCSQSPSATKAALVLASRCRFYNRIPTRVSSSSRVQFVAGVKSSKKPRKSYRCNVFASLLQ